MVGRPFTESFKNFLHGFLQFSGGISVSFLKKIATNLQISVLTIIRYSQNLRQD